MMPPRANRRSFFGALRKTEAFSSVPAEALLKVNPRETPSTPVNLCAHAAPKRPCLESSQDLVRSHRHTASQVLFAGIASRTKVTTMSDDKMYQFKVPENTKPGEELKMKFPGRDEKIIIQLPEGATPGEVIQFTVPADGSKIVGKGIGAAVGEAVAKGETESTHAVKKIQANIRGKSARKIALSRLNTQGVLVPEKQDKMPGATVMGKSDSGSSMMLVIAAVVAAAAYYIFQQGLLDDLISPPPPPPPVAQKKFLGMF